MTELLDKKKAAYEKRKAYAAEHNRSLAKAGQDIGELPRVKNPSRRRRALSSFRVFCETYFPHTFHLAWSPDHLKVIAKIETTVLGGGKLAIAMPRGAGKTVLCERAALWAILKGKSRYAVLIGADEGAATQNLETILTELQKNDSLLEDFPELCVPIRRLEGVHQRKLRYKGKQIHYEFTAKRIILPTMPHSRAADAVIEVAGLTARLRGRKYTRQDGRTVRPDLVLLDDPQTDESAFSPSQVADRERLISGAVLGLAGPGKSIAAFATVTVVCPDDLAERLLNRAKHPEWKGERTKMMYAPPANMKLWEKYWEMRSVDLQNDGTGANATEFYRANREEMDRGAVMAWPERFDPDEISAVQNAMNIRFGKPESFQSEYQNEPIPPKGDDELQVISGDSILRQVNGLERGLVPLSASWLTAFIDVQGEMLFWLVLATSADFTGAIVDYGGFPEQHRSMFSYVNCPLPMSKAAAEAGVGAVGIEGLLFWGLGETSKRILGREWKREDGAAMKVERCLIDANWGDSTDIVYQFCRTSEFATVLMPSHGRYIGAKHAQMHEWPVREGEKSGTHWRLRKHEKRAIRHVLIDTNFWKTFVHARMKCAVGDRGAYTINGKDKREHQLLADHLTAEAPVMVTANQRTLQEWQLRRPQLDNHWLDCLTGASVAASMQGAALAGMQAITAATRARKRYTAADFQRRAG